MGRWENFEISFNDWMCNWNINQLAVFPRRLPSLLASVLLMVRDYIALWTGGLSLSRRPRRDPFLDRILQLNPQPAHLRVLQPWLQRRVQEHSAVVLSMFYKREFLQHKCSLCLASVRAIKFKWNWMDHLVVAIVNSLLKSFLCCSHDITHDNLFLLLSCWLYIANKKEATRILPVFVLSLVIIVVVV